MFFGLKIYIWNVNNIGLILKKLKISTLAQNCCNFLLIKISSNLHFPGYFQLNFSKIDMAPFRPKTITILEFIEEGSIQFFIVCSVEFSWGPFFPPRPFSTSITYSAASPMTWKKWQRTTFSALYFWFYFSPFSI